MEQNEAVQKIDEIHSILTGANRVLFSGPQMIVIGILLCAVPLIHFITEGLSFGLEVIQSKPVLHGVLKAVIFGSLFYFVANLNRWKTASSRKLHPLLQKTFRFEAAFAALVFFTGVSLGATGQGQFTLPFVLIMLGFMFYIFSQHSIPTIRWASIGLMAGGIAYIWLDHKLEQPWFWAVGVVWMGLMYAWIGFAFLKNKEAVLAES